jgi:hypothetical protein
MNYLTTLRDQFNLYGSFSKTAAQSGGGTEEIDSEPEDYHTTYVSEGLDQVDNLIKNTNNELLKYKSNYYDIAISKAPRKLDQHVLLTTIIKEDLKQIANILLGSINMNFEKLNGDFKSSATVICKNNKVEIEKSENLDEYINMLNKEGLRCLRGCRIALNTFNTQTQNKNIYDCKNMINNIFITYVWSQYNRGQQEE